jgi:hypothetical protein
VRTLNCSIVLSAALAAPAAAQPVIVGSVYNFSSDNPSHPNRTFLTESTMSGITGGGGFYSFTHRMAAFNEHIATGGVAQTNKRNVNFRFDFTVEDHSNVGYTINLESLLRGVSYINQTVGTSTALATGIALDVRYGVNLADPSDSTQYTNLGSPIYGMSAAGTSVSGIGTNAAFGERYETGDLPGGVYTGTNTFSLYFTTVTTPTTNVLFQNNHEGMGFVNFGLGSDVAGFDVDPSDLGHFFTVNVQYMVPSPAGLAVFALGGLMLRSRRRR